MLDYILTDMLVCIEIK